MDSDAAHVFGADCDPEDPQREDGFYERFSDGIDSNCDGHDDPAMVSVPCSCDWLDATGMPEVWSRCGAGFDPPAAQLAVSSTSWPSSAPLIREVPLAAAAIMKARCEHDLSPGDTQIQGGVTASGGIITFTTDFTPGTGGTNYLVRATVSNLASGDTTTFSFGTADIDVIGATKSGSITNATHTQDLSQLTKRWGENSNCN